MTTHRNVRNNGSEVRFQFGPTAGLNLAGATAHMLDYYVDFLGMQNIYLPPSFQARQGSDHGYDGIDPRRIDPFLGDEESFATMAHALHEWRIGLKLDIVPNHLWVGPWEDSLGLFRANGVGSQLGRECANPFWTEELRDKFFDTDRPTGRWRRFFDVDDLVGLRVEDPEVFEATHALIIKLAERGFIDALRVDHPGGLSNPTEYLERLSACTGGLPITVEAVLLGDERLPEHWKVAGDVGYGFLNRARGLFRDPTGCSVLRDNYEDVCADHPHRHLVAGDFHRAAQYAKNFVATEVLGHEVSWLQGLLPTRLAGDVLPALASMDVYRTYIDPKRGFIPPQCRAVIERSSMSPELKNLLLLGECDDITPERRDEFVFRFQQWTGPCHAIGVENTTFFRNNPLFVNEVGCDPSNLSTSVAEFHSFNRETLEAHPHRPNPLMTHDAKLGSYPAARLGALTITPGRFCEFFAKWRKENAWLRVDGGPDALLERQIYQLMLATCPYPLPHFEMWLLKSMREAKVPDQTSWFTQGNKWEQDTLSFVRSLYKDKDARCAQFRRALEEYVRAINPEARHARRSNVVLMMTVPGRPSFYQEDETWEMLGVDPLNRLRVPRDERMDLRRLVPKLSDRADSLTDLVQIIRRLNALRNACPYVFDGAYTPLDEGDGCMTFARGDHLDVIVHVPQRLGTPDFVVPGYRNVIADIPGGLGVFVKPGLTSVFGA